MTYCTLNLDLAASAGDQSVEASDGPAMPLKVEFELDSPPNDGISCVEFCPAPASPLLLCSSWDSGLRLYDVQSNQQKAKIEHPVSVCRCCK